MDESGNRGVERPALTASPKQHVIRDEKYRRHIASQPCVCCGGEDVQAAHVRMGQEAGMGRKPGDDMCWPGCVKCHRLQGETGEVFFWKWVLGHANDETLAEIISAWRRDCYERWRKGND